MRLSPSLCALAGLSAGVRGIRSGVPWVFSRCIRSAVAGVARSDAVGLRLCAVCGAVVRPAVLWRSILPVLALVLPCVVLCTPAGFLPFLRFVRVRAWFARPTFGRSARDSFGGSSCK